MEKNYYSYVERGVMEAITIFTFEARVSIEPCSFCSEEKPEYEQTLKLDIHVMVGDGQKLIDMLGLYNIRSIKKDGFPTVFKVSISACRECRCGLLLLQDMITDMKNTPEGPKLTSEVLQQIIDYIQQEKARYQVWMAS